MIEYLLKLGYTKKQIDKYISEGKIVVQGFESFIIDPDLFTSYIAGLLKKSINPIFYFDEFDNNSLMYHVFKYISLGMYKVSMKLLERFIESNDSMYAKLLFIGLNNKKDKINYIIIDEMCDRTDALPYLKNQELELLISIELEDYKEIYQLVTQMKDSYSDYQSNLPFIILGEFLMEIRRLSVNHRKVSDHIPYNITGDFDSVVYELLKASDYFRLDKLIKDELESSNRSVKVEIYNLLSDKIIALNEKNTNYIKECMLTDVSTKSISDVLSYNHLPKMDSEFIENITNPKEIEKDNTNYYSIYEDMFNEMKYKEALEALIKFKEHMNKLDVYIDVDYLLNELNIFIENETKVSKTKRIEMHSLYREASKLMSENKYERAINILDKYNSICKIENPRIISLIGDCYFNMNNYIKSIECYTRLKDGFISPNAIYNLIYSYFKIGEYKKVINLIPKYEHYYPDENIKLHYIASICYVKLKEYTDAIDSLESCEAMNVIIYNMPIEYRKEKEIIRKIMNGKDIECYSEVDFVSYDMNDSEKELAYSIQNKEVNTQSLVKTSIVKIKGIKNKIEYLFSCAKVYLQLGYEDEGLEICEFIKSMLKDERLELKDRDTFTLRLKNYTTI